MFAYIKGRLELKTAEYVVIDVGGIGYKIFMSQTSIEKLSETEKEVKVYTYLKVREDDVSIYGFNTNEELRMFELLLSVSGIGAKSAIGILSSITPSKFALAVISDDVITLKKLPGVGQKSAQRIILELKDKLKTQEAVQEDTQLIETIKENDVITEVIAALQVLGYSRYEINKILPKLTQEKVNLEEMIKLGLRYLSK